VSSHAVRQARYSQNALARHVERVVSRRDEPSGIWAYLNPTYLSDSLRHVADLPGRQRLRSATSADLAVPQTRFVIELMLKCYIVTRALP